MVQSLSIENFFPPITSPRKKVKYSSSSIVPGDGFELHELPSLAPTPWSPKPGHTYVTTKIGAIKSGFNGSIVFEGRIANFRDYERDPKSSKSAKLLVYLTLQDDTGAIDVKYWVTTDAKAKLRRVKLGALVTVHTNFVDTLPPKDQEKTSSTNFLVISMSDNDQNGNVEIHEETEDNYADLRLPPGVNGDTVEGILPLKVYLDGETESPGIKLMVCVKWKGAKKTIPRKDGSTFEKRDVGIFDDTMEANLVLYGAATLSADSWQISKTILLITSPALKLWRQNVQLFLDRKSLIAIDPILRDAQWLRNYAIRLLRRPDLCLPFPEGEFDWEEGFYGETRLKYTFGDIDTYSRDVELHIDKMPGRQCVGYINVIILEMNAATLARKNMLLCGSCCGFTVFNNSTTADCRKCEKPITKLLPNPNIVGLITDETGSINGKHMIWSERAWCSFLGRTVLELTQADKATLKNIDDLLMHIRLTLMFGWSEEVGKIAIWDVLPC